MSSGSCSVPSVDFGILYKSATGEELNKPLVLLDVPPAVQKAIRNVCDQIGSAGSAAMSFAGDHIQGGVKTVAGKVGDELSTAGKTAGAIMNLDPNAIPEEHRDLIFNYLASQARNAPDSGLPKVQGMTEISAPDFVTGPVAGWMRADQFQAVFWIDDQRELRGAAVKMTWSLP